MPQYLLFMLILILDLVKLPVGEENECFRFEPSLVHKPKTHRHIKPLRVTGLTLLYFIQYFTIPLLVPLLTIPTCCKNLGEVHSELFPPVKTQ